MPRRTHTRSTRPIRGGIPWRGRHRLDHSHLPRVIERMIQKEEESERARAPRPANAGPHGAGSASQPPEPLRSSETGS